MVEYLASLPAIDFSIKSSSYGGLTAMGLARQKNKNNIIQILESAGARE